MTCLSRSGKVLPRLRQTLKFSCSFFANLYKGARARECFATRELRPITTVPPSRACGIPNAGKLEPRQTVGEWLRRLQISLLLPGAAHYGLHKPGAVSIRIPNLGSCPSTSSGLCGRSGPIRRSISAHGRAGAAVMYETLERVGTARATGEALLCRRLGQPADALVIFPALRSSR